MSLFLHGQVKSPFADAKVEQRGAGSAQRSDLILHDRDGKPALTGEIKLPDTNEGKRRFTPSWSATHGGRRLALAVASSSLER